MNGIRSSTSQRGNLHKGTNFILLGVMFAFFLQGAVGIAALEVVRLQTRDTIVKSIKVNELILIMDRELQAAQTLQRDFLLQYPNIGLSAAKETYALPMITKLASVVGMSRELRSGVYEMAVREALTEREVDLTYYLSAADRYSESFLELVELTGELAAKETGLDTRLKNQGRELETLFETEDLKIRRLFHQFVVNEKEYLITRRRPYMQTVFNIARQLKAEIGDSANLSDSQKTQARNLLDEYQATAEQILAVDLAIKESLDGFNIFSKSLEPVSSRLISMAQAEVNRGHANIVRANRIAIVSLLLLSISMAAVFYRIARIVDQNVIQNILSLTETASQLEAGDLSARTTVHSDDEIGALSETFNHMASELEMLTTSLESKVQTRTEELKRSNEELEQFAYVASHDLQEPLRMVASYLGLLERRYKAHLDEDALEFIGYAVDGATRMKGLINDLLVFSRVGTRGRAFEPADVNDILSQVCHNLSIAIEESGVLITNDELPTILADAGQLVQLFQNLISNAIKYRGDEPPRVQISARQDGNEWLFSVADNGIGIDPRYAERIFVIFQRLHTRDQSSGSGIGLAVAKKIVERHGGRIWVESESGNGATFYFTFPIKEIEYGDKPTT